ncbi:DUF2264 domain-containing protein [Metabacillus sp. 22489]|uniref:DUF2264 domain-containing protein n=1 Tax=Metabacillus sp. 22489 TaxID=3453928 RepID=UPI003F84512C
MQTTQAEIKTNPLKTKADVEQALKQICNPLKSSYSDGFARLQLGNSGVAYSDSIAGMEGFSRILWGLVPLLAGDAKEYDIWDFHLQGIKNGTNPAHEEYWGRINDYDQRIVEMAVFGLALLLIPDKIWEPLNEQERANLSGWLRQINHVKAHDCNWLFFPVLVNIGLKFVGEPYDEGLVEQNLQRIDEFYLGNGWYADGIDGHCDYYGPFAIHYYSLIYAKYMEKEDPIRAVTYKNRAEVFAKDFIHWFASDGSALPYGRSLTYRFAQAAFWSACVFANIEPFSLGVMKGLILRNLRWWFNKPIFNESNRLTVGYVYPNLVMAENYNSPGSPYWALKTFLPLALDEEHPFWQVQEEEYPKDLEQKSIQRLPHLALYKADTNRHLLAFNTGHISTNEHTHTSSKYEKFVYSNVFGFSVPRAEWGLAQGAFDCMLALSEGDNLYRVKRKSEEIRVEEDYLYMKWKPWHDVEVKTWLVPGNPWHVRIHRIETNRELDAADGGFALGLNDDELTKIQEQEQAFVRNQLGASGVKTLYGNGRAELIFPNANTNLINPRTVIPTIKTKVHQGVTLLASAVYGEKTFSDSFHLKPKITFANEQIIIQFSKKEVKIGDSPPAL